MTTKELVKDLKGASLPSSANKVFKAIENETEGFTKKLTQEISIGSKTSTPKNFLAALHGKFYKKAIKKATTATKKSMPKKEGRSLVARLTRNIQAETTLSYKKAHALAEKIIKERGLFKGRSDRGIRKDSKQPAKKFGKRLSKKGWKNQYGTTEGGNIYYEKRSNRADVPISKTYPQLKRGGTIEGELPQIYVVSQRDYNQKRDEGNWINLSKYGNGSEVDEAINTLLDSIDVKHGREEGWASDYAVHDFKGFPKEFFKKDMTTKDFDALLNFIEALKGNNLPTEVVAKYAKESGRVITEIETDLDSIYRGTSDSTDKFTYNYIRTNGLPHDATDYMDIIALGMELRKGFNDAEFYENEGNTDDEIARQYIADVYGDSIPKSTLVSYFNASEYWDKILADRFEIIDHQNVLYFFENEPAHA
tara:strand:- start:9761 stop:11026 length:1266 start_codon:yes stop_codon:yes gene_type:complete